MMKSPTFLAFLFLSLLLLSPSVTAQEVKFITVDDAASGRGGIARLIDGGSAPPHANRTDESIPQMPGWPVRMEVDPERGYLPQRSVVFADLNGDGHLEIIASSTDRKVYAWDFTGTLLPGFPADVEEHDYFAQETPSVGDLDGDGDLEIVQCTHGGTAYPKVGSLYALDHEGRVVSGFPVTFNGFQVWNSPTLADLDDDGDLEILATELGWPNGCLHVVEHDGTEWGGNWPFVLSSAPGCTPGVADVDGDGSPEIFCCSIWDLYLLDTAGNCLPGWPKNIYPASPSYTAPAFADLDNDGDLEILISLGGGYEQGCYVFNHDGSDFPGWPKMVGTGTYCPPTVADLEGDGELEILCGRLGFLYQPSACFYAWTASGDPKPGFPYEVEWGGGSFGPITVADINDDGRMEIFADHNAAFYEGHTCWGLLFGVDSTGNDLPGFPLRPGGFTSMNGATIGDVDGDGDYELGVMTILSDVNDWAAHVYLYDLPYPYRPSRVEWETFCGRKERGSLYQSGDRLHEKGYMAAGGTVELIVHDPCESHAWLWVSLGIDRMKHPDFGWFYLNRNLGFFKLIDGEPIMPGGEVRTQVTVPSNSGLIGVPVYIQGLTVSDFPAGVGRTTNLLRRVIQ